MNYKIVVALMLTLLAIFGVSAQAQQKAAGNKNDEVKAIEMMRLIHAIEITYKGGLGKGNFGTEVDIFREDFIDAKQAAALGVPKMTSEGDETCLGDNAPYHGYRFKLALSNEGGAQKFTLVATPENEAGRSFFIDESGVLRESKDPKAIANAQSPKVAK